LSHQGYDPIQYDQPDKFTDIGFIPPTVVPVALVASLGALFLMMAAALQWRHRFDGWSPIPDALSK
jgi:hypothetical protein